jgi:hypothetical protein
MENKDLNYNYYHKELVDAAKAFAENFYKENQFISDIKCLELAEKLPETAEKHKNDMQNLIYKQMLERFESAYLYGMQYAVANDIGSTKPSHESQLCQYQKDKDFAFVFKFGDNDFGNYFEHAAKLYCDSYNSLIGTIKTYTEFAPKSVKSYIKDIDNLEKRETIIEALKLGITSYTFQSDVDTYHPERMSFENSMKDANRYANEYFDFNGELQLWGKDENGEYIATGTEPRLVIGTRADVENAVKNYGDPYEETMMPQDFPYWCNGEALIVYMKDGFLTYMIR